MDRHAAREGTEPFIDGAPGVSEATTSAVWVELAGVDHYEGRHRRPRAFNMTPGMVYFSAPDWRRVGDYPDEMIDEVMT